MIEIDDVLLAIIAYGLRTRSKLLNTDFLTFAFYTIAYIYIKNYLYNKINIFLFKLLNISNKIDSLIE